jgi:hypothetical protein
MILTPARKKSEEEDNLKEADLGKIYKEDAKKKKRGRKKKPGSELNSAAPMGSDGLPTFAEKVAERKEFRHMPIE